MSPPLSAELLRKVRMIELTTRKRVDDMMSGQFKSHFKGSGVQFSEHRLYVPGDDIRHIDWKVSARSRDPLIKKYEEERELTVLLVVDVSGSENFGSSSQLKSEITAEIAGMLAYAAIHSGDKVGAILFAGKVEMIIPPRKGRSHILRIIKELLTYRYQTRGTDLEQALQSAANLMKHSGVVFVLSDFLAENYEVPLSRLSRKHDVVAISVTDAREKSLPDLGQFLFYDEETGLEHFVDTGSTEFKKWMDTQRSAFEAQTQSLLKKGRIEWLRVETREDYGEAVVRFFRARARRRS